MGKLVKFQRGIATVTPEPLISNAWGSQNASQERRFNRPRSTDCEHLRMKQHPKPSRGRHWSAVALTTALFAQTSAHAATTIPTLEPTVVVGTRTPLSMDRVSPSVSWIPREDLETWQDRSLIDTLRREPGIFLWANGAPGSVSSMSIRGTESSHSSFFVDGRRLNPGLANQYDLEFLNFSNTESVQIQRGPSSVQYGSSNIGGVVDTRMRSGLGVISPETNLAQEFGSNSYTHTGLQTRFGDERFGFSFSTDLMSTDNERANDDFSQNSFSSRIDYQLNDRLQLELIALGHDNDKDLPGSTGFPSDTDEASTSSWLISPGIRYADDDLSMHLFYSRSEWQSTGVVFGIFPFDNQLESDEVSFQADLSILDDSLLTVGAIYRSDDVVSVFNSYEEDFNQVGAFAQVLWMLTDDTEVRGGLRYDVFSDYDNEATGNIMLIQHFRDIGTSVFAKAANAYAPPAAQNIIFDADPTTRAEPERSQSYEIGINQSLMNDRLSGSLVFFHNEIDDLIESNDIGGGVFDIYNIKEATTKGIEASITYQPNEQWAINAGYTYLMTDSNDPDDPGDDGRLARRPKHQLQLNASVQPVEDLRVGLGAIGVFDRPSTEDFVVLRLVSEWQISEDWSIHGRIENLLDEEYSLNPGYPSLGRTAYIGAKYSF